VGYRRWRLVGGGLYVVAVGWRWVGGGWRRVIGGCLYLSIYLSIYPSLRISLSHRVFAQNRGDNLTLPGQIHHTRHYHQVRYHSQGCVCVCVCVICMCIERKERVFSMFMCVCMCVCWCVCWCVCVCVYVCVCLCVLVCVDQQQ
jgi:hypothetical protein